MGRNCSKRISPYSNGRNQGSSGLREDGVESAKRRKISIKSDQVSDKVYSQLEALKAGLNELPDSKECELDFSDQCYQLLGNVLERGTDVSRKGKVQSEALQTAIEKLYEHARYSE